MGAFTVLRGRAPPPSVSTPVQGTSLVAIWNLQYSGTGPRGGYINGAWPSGITPGSGNTNTGIPAYLANIISTGVGFVWANHDGAIFLNVGSSTVTISNYDFTLAPPITWDGTGAVIFNDCTFPQTAAFLGNALASPCNINGTINTTPGSTLTTTCNYCTYNQGVFFAGSGTWANDHCLGTNLNQQWGGASAATITNTWCYVPGLGVAPPTSGTIHIEAIQFNANSPATMTWQSCLVNVAAEGQPNVGSGQSNYGWTAIVTSPVGTGVVLYQNCIFIGLTEMNASTVGNNHIPYFITYGQVTPVTITNCILESGVFGYTSNGDGGANRPVDGGGNRTFTNAALTSASSGWN